MTCTVPKLRSPFCLWLSKCTAPSSGRKSKVKICLSLEICASRKMADLTKFGKQKSVKSIQINIHSV